MRRKVGGLKMMFAIGHLRDKGEELRYILLTSGEKEQDQPTQQKLSRVCQSVICRVLLHQANFSLPQICDLVKLAAKPSLAHGR